MSKKPKGRISFFVRLAIGLGLVIFLLRTLEAGDLEKLRSALRPVWLLAAAGVIVVIRILMSIRWQDVLRLQGIEVGLGELIKITFISMFFGHFLPGGLGTDIVRGYELISRRGKTADITATLILDRCIGVYSMFFIALIGSMIGGYKTAVIWLVGAQLLILGGWVVGYFIADRCKSIQWFEQTKLKKIWAKLLLILVSITDLQKIRTIFLKVFLLSVVVQLCRCLMFYCVYKAFSADVSYIACLTIIPLVYVIVLIPVSVSGLGVRETALVKFFEPLGIEAGVSIGVGLVSHLLQIVVALPGLLLWVFDKKKVENKV